MRKATFMAVIAALAVGASAQDDARARRTGWFKDAGWGVFTHYLSDIALQEKEATVDNWNAAVDGFDVQGLARQLKSVGAKYYVITLGQNSGFYLSPNPAYDKHVGISPSKCSRRDLVADLYDALSPHGIRLMVYLPAGAPDRDPVAMEKLGWAPGKYPIWSHPEGGPDGGDPRLVDFQRKWEEIIADWSKRWGNKVVGWWFDGCYYPVAMYKHADAPNFASFAAAARAGNPDSIVAFNPGVFDPIRTQTPEEDYTAGEINDAWKAQCPGRFLDGAQMHMLSYLGPNWAQTPPRYTDGQVVAITRRFNDKEGVVTWDVPIQPNGLIPEAFVRQLAALNDGLSKRGPEARGMGMNPNVVEGLEVTPAGGMALRVAPGKIRIGEKIVEVAKETAFNLAPPRIVQVRNEETTLTDQVPEKWGRGTGLKGCISVGSSLEGCMVPDSLVVKSSPGPDAPPYVEGKDWRADKAWGRVGRIEGGAIGADTKVYIDYRWQLMRLDTIQVDSDGRVTLRTGNEHRMCPEPPKVDMDAVALCNIYLPYGTKELTEDLIYPVGAAFEGPSSDLLERNISLIPKSREKLAKGEPLTLLFWGDSVTCGGDTSTPDKAFPQAFTAWLRNKYPQSHITYVNAGTGGWNTETKLPLFQQEVIDKKPDLVVIEFVNDMGFDRERIFKNYTEAVNRIREVGGEVIILTPHFVRPDWMPAEGMRTHETRAAVTYLKEFAAANKVPIADAARRWEHLWIEGLPYMTLLYNGINHPDDRGHRLFVEELQRLFP